MTNISKGKIGNMITKFKSTNERRPVYGREMDALVDALTDGTSTNLSVDEMSVNKSSIAKSVVNQLTAITTGVTINTSAGMITTVSSTLAAGSNASFTVTNSKVKADSIILLTVDDSKTAGLAKLNVQTIATGSFVVNITNIHSANAFNNTINIYFLIV